MTLAARPTTDLELAISVTLQKIAGIALVATLTFQGWEAEHVGDAIGQRAV
jgi:hypothetical protein